jgi:hypothetical protein
MPEAGRELGSGGVVGAHERDRAWSLDERFEWRGDLVPSQRHIATPVVTFRDPALDQPGTLENVEVVGEEVPPQSREVSQLGHRSVAEREVVDDEESPLITQCGMLSCPCFAIHQVEQY